MCIGHRGTVNREYSEKAKRTPFQNFILILLTTWKYWATLHEMWRDRLLLSSIATNTVTIENIRQQDKHRQPDKPSNQQTQQTRQPATRQIQATPGLSDKPRQHQGYLTNPGNTRAIWQLCTHNNLISGVKE